MKGWFCGWMPVALWYSTVIGVEHNCLSFINKLCTNVEDAGRINGDIQEAECGKRLVKVVVEISGLIIGRDCYMLQMELEVEEEFEMGHVKLTPKMIKFNLNQFCWILVIRMKRLSYCSNEHDLHSDFYFIVLMDHFPVLHFVLFSVSCLWSTNGCIT